MQCGLKRAFLSRDGGVECSRGLLANAPDTSMEICQSRMKPLMTVATMKATDANVPQMPVTNTCSLGSTLSRSQVNDGASGVKAPATNVGVKR